MYQAPKSYHKGDKKGAPGLTISKSHRSLITMHRQAALALLKSYEPLDDRDGKTRDQTIAFIEAHEDCLMRTCLTGHLTASAFVLNPQRDSLLLLHHRKLDRWLQPGGHADGDADLLKVAIREVEEETGLPARALMSKLFDIDIHEIPARKSDPAHLHFDFRFALESSSSAININDESFDARWISLQDVESFTSEPSIVRMVHRWRTREWQTVAH